MNKNQLIKIALGALVLVVIVRILTKRSRYENYGHDDMEEFEQWEGPESWETVPPSSTAMPTQSPGPQLQTPGPLASSVSLLPQTSPAPKPGQQSWAEFAPQSLQGQQLLDPVKFIGTDTQGSTLKNASWDLRRTPPVTRVDTGPFLQSSYEADPWRKPLDDCS